MRVGDYDIPFDTDGQFYTYFSPKRPDAYIPAWTVVNGTADPAKIRDKIVFVGTSAEGLKDIRSTPVDVLVPGVEAHINVVEQILSKNYLLRPKLFERAEKYTIIGTGFLIILLLPFVGAVAMAIFTGTLVASIIFMSWYGFHVQHLLLDPVYPSICVIIIFGLSVLLSYIRTEAERRQVKSAFGHYISPDLLDELAKNPDKLKLGGETRELTVMFTDIRGFTTIAESMKPEELIQLMNDFLTPMSDLVMSNRGTIDKYMGDAMMAFWNAPLDDTEHARHACTAALKMNRALDPINDGLRQRAQNLGRSPLLLKAGIGLNSGSTSVGNMGSKQRFAYSAIGDTVNLASRLEGQTRTYNASVIIGEATQKHVPDFATLELDLIQVKGKTEPARIFALVGDDVYATPEFKKWAATHSDMIKAYRDADFDLAMRMMEKCREQAEPRFKNLYALYEERIRDMLAHPPGEDWDGVYVATSKK
jgi:adenylate cyclase